MNDNVNIQELQDELAHLQRRVAQRQSFTYSVARDFIMWFAVITFAYTAPTWGLAISALITTGQLAFFEFLMQSYPIGWFFTLCLPFALHGAVLVQVENQREVSA